MADQLRPLDNFYTRHLAYDVLGQEFVPPSDPDGRVHTLARLALAVYESGVECQSLFGGPVPYDTTVYQRSPSWAPGVDATLLCRVKAGRGGIEDMAGLTLEYGDEDGPHEPGAFRKRPADYRLDLQTWMTGANALGLDITEWQAGRRGDVQSLAVTLGPRLIEARLIVGQAAQRFFDRLPAAS